MDIKTYISSGLAELYVMGLCSPEEEKEIELYRRQYPELHQAILQYEQEMEAKMQQQATLPPPAVDEKILRTLEAVSAPQTITTASPAAIKKMNWWKPAAAAAVLLLLASLYINYTLYRKNKEQAALIAGTGSSPLPASDYAVITNPAITPVAMYGVGTHTICRCTMFWDKKTGKAYIMIHHLPRSSSSRDYYLWATVNGKPVNVGVINDEVRGRFIEVPGIPSGSIAFIVTLEQSGGAPAPTLGETYLEGRI